MKTQTGSGSKARIRRTVGSVLATLVAVMLSASASTKFARLPSVVSQLAAAGITDKRLLFVAVLEMLSALLLLIPATRSVGLLFVSAFLGGAIATHLQHGKSIVSPSIILALIWFGSWLRHPEILWSGKHGGSTVGVGEPE